MGAPLYQLLGGPTRTKVRVLTPLKTGSVEELKRAWDAGARAFSVPLPERPYDVVGRLETLRSATGEAADFVLSCEGRLRAAEAARIARSLERFHLLWMDEPCRNGMKAIAEETVVPLGFSGSLERMRDLLREGVAGILRPDLDKLGATGVRKIAALAETYYVAVAPLSVNDNQAIQVAASLANFFIHESRTLPLRDGYLEVHA